MILLHMSYRIDSYRGRSGFESGVKVTVRASHEQNLAILRLAILFLCTRMCVSMCMPRVCAYAWGAWGWDVLLPGGSRCADASTDAIISCAGGVIDLEDKKLGCALRRGNRSEYDGWPPRAKTHHLESVIEF